MADARARSLMTDCARFRFPTRVRRRDTREISLVQWLVDRSDRRRPDARPSQARRRRASRSGFAPRRDCARRRMASDLRPGRGRAESSRAPADRLRAICFFLRMLSARRESRRRVPLRPRRAETSRHLRMAPGRQSGPSYQRPRCRNSVGRRTSASRRARAIQKQHSLFRQRPSFFDWPRRERRRNLRPDST